jgi:hypothetical protein
MSLPSNVSFFFIPRYYGYFNVYENIKKIKIHLQKFIMINAM